MKNILKIATLFCLVAMVMLMMASCDSIFVKVEVGNGETTPQATTPEDTTTPENVTTPEDVTDPEDVTTPEDVTDPEDGTTPEDVTTPEETEPVECNHEWADATSCLTHCTKCGYVAYRESGEHTLNDDTYACIKCGMSFYLTAEEAYEIGMSYAKGEYSDEYYYVELTLDHQVNVNGFGRATVTEGHYISVVGGYLTGDAEGSIQVGDTVIYKAKIGAVNSALAANGKEARLYEVAAYNNITVDVTPPDDIPCTHPQTEYVPELDATCTTDGRSDYWKCALCGEQLTATEIIPAEHTEVIDERVEPTCTQNGLTEGSHCSVCGKVLKKQNNIQKLFHAYGDYTFDDPTTAMVTLTYTCQRCDDFYTETITPVDFTITQENRHMIDSIPEYPEIGYDSMGFPMPPPDAYIENLIIPAIFENEGVWYRVVAIGDDAFEYVEFSEVVIPNTVTAIGNGSFANVGTLDSITIPSSVTSIGERAFVNCYSLTSITFAINSRLTSIGEDAFYCYSDSVSNDYSRLADVYIFETDVATWLNISFGNANAHPNNFGTLHILDADGNEVTKLIIPGLSDSYESYEISAYAFANCCNVTELFIPYQVSTIGSYAFSNCSNLTSLTVEHSAIFLANIGSYAFSNCTNLTSITFRGCPIYIWEQSVNKGENWNYNVPATEIVFEDGVVSLN